MDPSRSLMIPRALQRVVHLVRRFDQCRCGVRAFSKKSIEALDAENDGTKKPRPKTVKVPKITLISPNNSITVTILEDAQRLAKRRNLALTKITDFDSKSERAIYKLTSNSDNIEETAELEVEDKDKDKQKVKSAKVFYISATIAEYDLKTKLKNIVRLLNKKYKIKLVINLDDSHEAKTKSIIEDVIKDHGSIQQMPAKKNMLLLVITPLSNDDTSVNSKEKTGANSQSNNA